MDNPDGGNSNTSWVFDSLIGFLHGPVWNIPLQTFIEEKSLPFEPSMSGDIVDQPEYKKIHDEYKNLVDVMLGSFMDDIGITAEQFEAACRMSARNIAGLPPQFHRRLFEQIWAANDYDIFVKMMTHKNVELQLQALELIERRFGSMPHIFLFNRPLMEESVLDSSRSDGDGDSCSDSPDEDDVMVELKKLQITEIDDDIVEVPPKDVMAEKKSLLSKLHKFGNKEIEKTLNKSAAPTTSAEEITPQPVELPKPPPPPPKKIEVSEEDLRNRQEYLKQQRDKLLAMKKEVREKRLGAAVTENDALGGEGDGGGSKKWIRPKSAHVAKAAMAGAPPTPPPDAMQMRRALATKLKTEVVDTNN